MAKKTIVKSKQRTTSIPKGLILVPSFVFLIKIILILRIQGLDWYAVGQQDLAKGLQYLLESRFVPPNVWFGSDGENYVSALLGLAQDGIYSQARNLYYWPAGYPIFMWLLSYLFDGYLFLALSIFQSLIYAISCFYFVIQIRLTRLSNFAYPISLILALNPTLSLSSMVVGYESLVASCLLLATGLLLNFSRTKVKKLLGPQVVAASLLISFASFLQPRTIALGFVLFLIWGLSHLKIKAYALFLIATILLTSLSSVALAWRNHKAMGFVAVSTNLGVTMNIGAGKESTGGYSNAPRGVDCPSAVGDVAEQDAARVRCVLNWYFENPTESLRLFWNKSTYFWSPWFGPLANGTMGRNPWLEVHPLKETIKERSGFDMVAGPIGKTVSWAWIMGNVILFIAGWRVLWKLGGIQRLWGTAAFSMVIANWLISLVTIGDHRFRIPTMTLSLTLQVIALFALRARTTGSRSVPGEDVAWPILHWNRVSEPANLRSETDR